MVEAVLARNLKRSTPGVTAFELIKRAYESNTLDKLRDFLSVEPQPGTG